MTCTEIPISILITGPIIIGAVAAAIWNELFQNAQKEEEKYQKKKVIK